VLPSGPTLLDMMANMAFWHGLTHALATLPDAPEHRLPFAAARANFYAAARHGLRAELAWLDGASLSARDLVLRVCLPLAELGLLGLGLGEDEIESNLGIIRARTLGGQTGADWQLRRYDRLGGDLEQLMADYLENQRAGMPLHEWDA
jgi:gamma-glutamyl:cysteine ligase YbdK (ATP-grasp superfamily)